jgi:hypothetical protein
MAKYSRLWEIAKKTDEVSSVENEPLSKELEPEPVVESATLTSSEIEPIKPIDPVPAPKSKKIEPDQKDIIDISAQIADTLRLKAKEFNSDNGTNVTYSQLEKAFLRGVSNHEKKNPILCALARVNMYLSMRSGKPQYKIDREKTTSVNFLDLTEYWIPNDECFAKAKEDADKFNLNYEFINIRDLYLTEHKKPIWNLY